MLKVYSQEELLVALSGKEAVLVDYSVVHNLGIVLLKATIVANNMNNLLIIVDTGNSLPYLIFSIENGFKIILVNIEKSIYLSYKDMATKYECLLFNCVENLIEYLNNKG